ncbi:MAG: tRNA (guanine-N1)-methyltransferase [Flavobacteriaceae bacterium]|nr:tRNA (guanine-N1)-methyltransferase [Bacteroidia bacterium]NNL15738.1 tRNA (guanine-N1)-methyltransferase [Flavobacteriaceae bacterium]
MIIKKLTFLLFLLNLSILTAQNPPQEKLSLNSGTIDNQFEFVITKSNRYQEYKVVKTTWLYALKAHTIDSLNAVKAQLNSTKQLVENQDKEIEVLKTNLADTNATLDQTNLEKNSMSLFGILMSKTGYNLLMWSIIAGLLAFLLFFIYKFKNSNAITRQAKLSLSETEEEFEEHRKRALEREQKVMRRLQDELNKQKAKTK